MIPADSINKLLRPASVAVVGATPRESATGFRVLSNLLAGGFDGGVYPVNPKYDEVLGHRCFRSVSDLPRTIDLVFVAVPASGTPAIVEEAGRRGVRAIVVNASGFADAGSEGRVLQDRVASIARDRGIALCGPNNNGLMNFLDRIMLCVPRPPVDPKPGGVAVISQSGSVSFTLSRDRARIGLGYVISAGNEAVLSVADYLAAVVRDERVQIVLLFLETIRHPAHFAAAAAEAARLGKPVLVVKVGCSQAAMAAVAAHTDALAGEDAIYDAFFRRHGIVRLSDLDELIEAASLFVARPHPPVAKGVVAVTLSGGGAALIADIAAMVGLSFATYSNATADRLRDLLPTSGLGNPLDAWGLGWNDGQLRQIVETVAVDPAIGVVVPQIESGTSGGINRTIASICVDVAKATGKSFVVLNNSAAGDREAEVRDVLGPASIPYLTGLRYGLGAIARWLAHCPPPPTQPGLPSHEAEACRRLALDSPGLSEPDRFRRMSELGLPMAPCRQVESADEAEALAISFGYPVVLKGTAPHLLHKTDLGLVKVDLRNGTAVRLAYADLAHRLSALSSLDAAVIVVQPQVPSGCELILGVRNVAGFGTAVLLGLGGTMVTLARETAIRLGPVSVSEVFEMLEETSAGLLMKGFRGQGPLDRDSVARAVVALSQFGAAAFDLVSTVEINPLIVGPSGKGAWAVDAVVELFPSGERH